MLLIILQYILLRNQFKCFIALNFYVDVLVYFFICDANTSTINFTFHIFPIISWKYYNLMLNQLCIITSDIQICTMFQNCFFVLRKSWNICSDVDVHVNFFVWHAKISLKNFTFCIFSSIYLCMYSGHE